MENVDVETDIVVNRPIEAVAAYAANPTNVRERLIKQILEDESEPEFTQQ